MMAVDEQMLARLRRFGGRDLCQPCFDAAMADPA